MSGIHRRYNNYGYRTDLIDLASGDLLHQVVERDNWGNITREIRGNGYSTYYTYDKYFGRLKHQYADNGASDQFRIQDIAYEWDAVGNLKSRHNQSAYADQSDKKNLRESFCYDSLNRLIKANIGTTTAGCSSSTGAEQIRYNGLGNITYKHDVGYSHYGTNAPPHAVTQACDAHYSYYANGNQISGALRSFVYNSNTRPIRITK